MTKVCVVGGGTAGLQAAVEAESHGSEVIVVEKEEPPDLPWRDLPDLIAPGPGGPEPPTLLHRSASFDVLSSEARQCEAGLVRTSRGDVRCDTLVLATGSSFEAPGFRGSRKPGVFLLDSQRSYQDLGRESGALGRVVITGEGRRCLEVADRLTGGGRRIQVVVSSWQAGPPPAPIMDVISEAAEERGVTISSGKLTDAVGRDRVEAAVIDGAVIPCDSLVFAPRRLPRVPIMKVSLGRAGAVLVGRDLAASAPRTFAAGGCAEVEGVVPPSTLAGEPSSSGRIAGANSGGEGLSLSSSWSAELFLFGLRWVRMSARQSGETPAVDHVGFVRSGEGTACEIDFDRRSGRVTGIEFATAIGSRAVCGLPYTLDLNLRSLAYGGAGSSDISLISETARLGVIRWQRY